MAASNASNEQRLALREDLKRQLADMRSMQEAAERAKAEQQELLARIAAMESKVRPPWMACHRQLGCAKHSWHRPSQLAVYRTLCTNSCVASVTTVACLCVTEQHPKLA